MKRKLLILTLSLGLLMLGATAAFADTTDTFGHGYGHGFYDSDLTAEEIYALKIERIDQLVADGSITAEQAENFKAIMAQRQTTCDGLGTNRDDNERLGIGFGDGLRDGSGSHGGHGRGFRNR